MRMGGPPNLSGREQLISQILHNRESMILRDYEIINYVMV
jgi:hypothetical protein